MSTERQALIDKMDAEIEQARLQMEKMQAKAKVAEADARLDMNEQIRKLQQKRDDVADKLKEIKEAGPDAIEDLRKGAEHAWRELSSAAKNAAQRF
jgi:uncharacterized coiled-coil DUF342 family protein